MLGNGVFSGVSNVGAGNAVTGTGDSVGNGGVGVGITVDVMGFADGAAPAVCSAIPGAGAGVVKTSLTGISSPAAGNKAGLTVTVGLTLSSARGFGVFSAELDTAGVGSFLSTVQENRESQLPAPKRAARNIKMDMIQQMMCSMSAAYIPGHGLSSEYSGHISSPVSIRLVTMTSSSPKRTISIRGVI